VNIEPYLASLYDKLQEMEGLITSKTIQQEIDGNLRIGFIKGFVAFIDGSRLDFTEQLPTERCKFRFHFMDNQQNLIVRWDSAPHHKELSTFPFHKHTEKGAEEHRSLTLLQTLEEIYKMIIL